jgi:dienelactone hydrolase
MAQIISGNLSSNHHEISGNKTSVSIPFHDFFLNANLYLPKQPVAFVIFSHGSGSSRFSPRNNYVAEILHRTNIASLLADLLTPKEDAAIQNRFNISLLTERLKHLTQWAAQQPELRDLPVGYFGASTGAASAINAAAFFGDQIKAVVSRGGRPDLATENALQSITSPTLLIIGSLDDEVIKVSRKAYEKINCIKHIEIVQGASHLFEETGKLNVVSRLAKEWFEKYLVNPFVAGQQTYVT